MLNDRSQPGTARIIVTVTEFHEIGEGRGCSHADIELVDTGNGKVSQGRINDTIVVDGDVYLEFLVQAGQGDHLAYQPVGIGFLDTVSRESAKSSDHDARETGSDTLGNAAFPVRHVVSRGSTTQLTIYDANPERAEFEFSLLIQRSDGLLSVVDPKIRNSGVMA